MSILKPNEIDISRMRYSEAKQNAAGGRTVYINYAGDDGRDGKMYIQTPTMYLPWGLSSWENKKFNVDISFNEAPDKLTGIEKVFSDKLNSIHDKIVKDALERSADWLKKKFKVKDLPILKEFFNCPLRKSVDKETGEATGKFPDTLRVKVYKNRDESWVPEVYDHEKHKIDVDEGLVKGAKVKCLLQLQSVWIAGGNNFGISYSLHQAKVMEGSGNGGLKKGYNFVDDSDEDEEEEGSEEEEEDD
mgnify:FL=1